jgi:hypothetical protein
LNWGEATHCQIAVDATLQPDNPLWAEFELYIHEKGNAQRLSRNIDFIQMSKYQREIDVMQREEQWKRVSQEYEDA